MTMITKAVIKYTPVKILLRHAPLIGALHGFTTTAVTVYNATTPTQAIIVGTKGIILNCTPPVIKYPALCLALVGCMAASVHMPWQQP
jgi:hypothetical protein